MQAATNPYLTPSLPPDEQKLQRHSSRPIDTAALIAWPAVFAMNLVLPVLWGLSMTPHHGRIGVVIASLLALSGGWLLCLKFPLAARRLIAGSAILSVTQLFPVLQLIIGIIAIAVGDALGFIDNSDDNFPAGEIISEVGGFLVTMLVGGALLMIAAGIGLGAGVVLPGSWFERGDAASPTSDSSLASS